MRYRNNQQKVRVLKGKRNSPYGLIINIFFAMVIVAAGVLIGWKLTSFGLTVTTEAPASYIARQGGAGVLKYSSCEVDGDNWCPQFSKKAVYQGNDRIEWAYCTNAHHQTPSGQTATKSEAYGPGMTAIIQNGYPNKSIIGSADDDYYITQVAVWWYLDRIDGVSDNTNGLLSASFKTSNYKKLPQNVYTNILSLRDLGVNARDQNPSISISASGTLKLVSGTSYYESSDITVTLGGGLTQFQASVTGVTGAYLVDSSGNTHSGNNFNAGTKIRVRVPASSVTSSNLSVQVSASGSIPKFYTYRYVTAGFDLNNTNTPQPVVPAILYQTSSSASSNKVTLNVEALSRVGFAKTDITTNGYVSGARLKVTNASGTLIDEWTSGSGVHYIDNMVPGNYTLTEISAPDGYLVHSAQNFTVTAGSTNQVITMKNEYTNYSFLKRDKDGNAVVGAVLRVVDANNQVIDEWTSSTSTHSIVRKLVVGKTYRLIEVSAPDGYLVNTTPVSFTVLNTSSVQSITMTNDYTDVAIVKKDTDGVVVPGVRLKLVDATGNTVDTWTTTTEPYHIKKKLVAGKKYQVVEISAPPGYIVREDPYEFTVNRTSAVQTITVQNTYTKILISKTDASTSKPIYGVTFLIKDDQGKEKYQFNIEEEACKITNLSSAQETEVATVKNACLITKIPIGSYTLEEKEAPEGYVINPTPIDFEVRNNGDVQRVIVKHNYTKLKIVGNRLTVETMLMNITFSIQDSKGMEVDRFTTKGKPYTISNLPLGKYTIREVDAPEGYIVNPEPVEFEITGGNQEIMFPNDFIKVQISKRDITNEKEVPGAKLELRNAKGKLIDQWTSKDEEHWIEKLKPGKYTLKETVVPEGYEAKTTTISFEVKETGEVQKVIMYNAPIIEVPDTKASVPVVLYVIGGVILLGGIGLIYGTVLHKKKKH